MSYTPLKMEAAVQMLSQDLLNASLQIPFSVPPYMSLLARAVATLEGIALTGNPDYQMVAEVCGVSPVLSMECCSFVAVCRRSAAQFRSCFTWLTRCLCIMWNLLNACTQVETLSCCTVPSSESNAGNTEQTKH